MKKSYEIYPVQETIRYAIQILIEEFGRCTPTEVLRFALFEENKAMRSLVLELAEAMEYTVKSSGKGYVITDTPIEIMPLREYEIEFKMLSPFISDGIDTTVYYFDCFAKSEYEALELFASDNIVSRNISKGYSITDIKVTIIEQ